MTRRGYLDSLSEHNPKRHPWGHTFIARGGEEWVRTGCITVLGIIAGFIAGMVTLFWDASGTGVLLCALAAALGTALFRVWQTVWQPWRYPPIEFRSDCQRRAWLAYRGLSADDQAELHSAYTIVMEHNSHYRLFTDTLDAINRRNQLTIVRVPITEDPVFLDAQDRLERLRGQVKELEG